MSFTTIWAASAFAATIPVNTLVEPGADDGQCSLSEAVYSALNDDTLGGCPYGSGDDEITFPGLAGTITLAADLTVFFPNTGTLTISGPGADVLTIDGQGARRIFQTSAGGGTYAISGLTLANGASGNPGGAALWVDRNDVMTVSDCVFTGSTSTAGGGAIYNRGQLTLLRSVVTLNEAQGGYGGGGILTDGTLVVVDSAIIGNSAPGGDGGGVLVYNGLTTLVNSTLSGNQASNGGGITVLNAVAYSPGSEAWLIHTTVTGNVVTDVLGTGGGLRASAPPTYPVSVMLRNSVVAGNTAGSIGPDCSMPPDGGVVSDDQGYNLIGVDQDCVGRFGAGTSVVGTLASPVDAGLESLAENGSPLPTHRPLAGSPLLDAVPTADCLDATDAPLAADQRGFARPAGAACDIGAHEVGCGDGVVDAGEACDDGNTVDDDTCTNACEIGIAPPPTDTGTETTPPPETTDTDPTDPTETTDTGTDEDKDQGCGCATGSTGSGVVVLAALLGLARRRARASRAPAPR
jgi:MYXO-CTERM domain-containing protein